MKHQCEVITAHFHVSVITGVQIFNIILLQVHCLSKKLKNNEAHHKM